MQLEQEMEKSRILEECLRVLAQEHLSLEQSISGLKSSSIASSHTGTARQFASSPSAVTSSEMDEFFDCGNDAALTAIILHLHTYSNKKFNKIYSRIEIRLLYINLSELPIPQ